MKVNMENCIFCKIVAKQIPSSIVHEDEDLLVFKDINPSAPVHLLIIPKKHISCLDEVQVEDVNLLGKMLLLAPKIAQQLGCESHIQEGEIRSGGYKTLINTGAGGGQVVYHLHMHLLGGLA